METTHIGKGLLAVIVLGVAIYAGVALAPEKRPEGQAIDPTPQDATLSGTYGCLPHANPNGPQTEECAFGIKSDDGVWYAVNFGQSADAMQQFRSGAHVTLRGFVVPKEALSSDHWALYDMKGIFTATEPAIPGAPAVPQGKLDIHAVCESALAYMSFPDGASSDAFVQACVRGEHPEVIERYKADMNLGDGAAI